MRVLYKIVLVCNSRKHPGSREARIGTAALLEGYDGPDSLEWELTDSTSTALYRRNYEAFTRRTGTSGFGARAAFAESGDHEGEERPATITAFARLADGRFVDPFGEEAANLEPLEPQKYVFTCNFCPINLERRADVVHMALDHARALGMDTLRIQVLA